MDLDKTSRHILIRLGDYTEATASDLVEDLGLEQNQSVHYRMDTKLKERDLVEEGPRREQPGSRKAARTYRLTQKGEEWVNKHQNEVTLTSLDEAEEELERLSEQLSELSETVEELSEWRAASTGKLGGIKSRMETLNEQIEDIDYRVEKHDVGDYNQRISTLSRKLSDLNTDYQKSDNELGRQVSDVESDVRSLSRQLGDIEDHVNHVEQQQMDIADHLQSIETRLNELENRSLWTRLRRWFSR